MATPDDTQTAAPPDYPSPQEIQAALAARGVTAAAAPPPSAAPAAAADPTQDYIRQQLALLQAPLPSVHPDTTPAQGGIVGLLGKIGMALAGGSVTDTLSPAQRERAGIRALGDFGTSLMAGSGYYPGKPMFGGLAQGFEGASRSEAGSEQQAASYLGAQQNWQMEQQKLQMERIKEALPLLQMEYGATIPNPLLANAPVVPGTAGGAGKPGGGGVALTPFIAKNLPAGVTPAEDQMVRTVYGEARGEPLAGQQGVAAVIKNRMAAGNQDAQGVIFKPGAFSSWADKQRPDMEALSPSDPQYQDILNKAVRPVMSGDAQDPTGGATNFYAPKLMPGGGPSWAANQQPSATIGGHQFYKLPYGAGTQVAGPGAPTGGPAAPAAPSTATDTPPPPAASPAPGEQSFEQFRAQNLIDPASLMPDLAQAKAAQAAAAQQLSLARAGRGGDPNKSLSDYNTATDAVNKLHQEANAKVLDAQRQLYDAKQQRQAQAAIETQKIQAAAAEAERQRQAAVALKKQEGDQAIELANVNSGNKVNADFQTELNTDMKNMGTRVDDLQLLRGLSDNVGTATPLTSIKFGGRSLADIISTTGFGGQDLRDKAGAVQAFRAGVLNVVRDLRSGGAAAGEPRSNQDLQFVMDMAPNEWENPNTRSAIISYLQQVGQRRYDLAAEATRQMTTTLPNGRPMPGGLAYEAARAKLPDMVPQLPKDGLQPGPVQDQFFAGLKPYTFFRKPNGGMALYTARNRPAQQ